MFSKTESSKAILPVSAHDLTFFPSFPFPLPAIVLFATIPLHPHNYGVADALAGSKLLSTYTSKG